MIGGETRGLELALGNGADLSPNVAARAGAGDPGGPAGATQSDQDDGGSVLASPWFWLAIGAVAAGTAVGLTLALSSETTRAAEPYGGDTDVVLRGP